MADAALKTAQSMAAVPATADSLAALSHLFGREVPKAAVYWTVQIVGWLAFGAAMFVWGLSHWTVAQAVVNKAILVAVGVLLTVALRWLYRKSRTRALSAFGYVALAAVASFGIGVVWIEAHSALFQIWYDAVNNRDIAPAWTDLYPGTVLFFGFVLFAWSLCYFGINAWSELEAQRRRTERAEALAREARLRALQSQLEPHFLFNTLNAVSTLVAEGQNAAASRMIARLGEFLRLTIDAGPTPEIPVAEELEFVRRYLEIEQVRFGDRLRVEIDVDPGAFDALVPALILQPLVENAIKHGIQAREDGGDVVVRVWRRDDAVGLSVADDGPGLDAEGDSSSRRGLGLTNVEERLLELYGDGARLRVHRPTNGGFEVSMVLPFRRAAVGEEVR